MSLDYTCPHRDRSTLLLFSGSSQRPSPILRSRAVPWIVHSSSTSIIYSMMFPAYKTSINHITHKFSVVPDRFSISCVRRIPFKLGTRNTLEMDHWATQRMIEHWIGYYSLNRRRSSSGRWSAATNISVNQFCLAFARSLCSRTLFVRPARRLFSQESISIRWLRISCPLPSVWLHMKPSFTVGVVHPPQ